MRFAPSLRNTESRRSSPPNPTRKKRIRHDKQAYKGRNLVERCFCRLKDWRRIATRYDKLARNFLSALCFVAMSVEERGTVRERRPSGRSMPHVPTEAQAKEVA